MFLSGKVVKNVRHKSFLSRGYRRHEKNLLDESVTTDITALASDRDNTNSCDKDFVGFTEYRANCTVEKIKASTSTSERYDGETSKVFLVSSSVISQIQ